MLAPMSRKYGWKTIVCVPDIKFQRWQYEVWTWTNLFLSPLLLINCVGTFLAINYSRKWIKNSLKLINECPLNG